MIVYKKWIIYHNVNCTSYLVKETENCDGAIKVHFANCFLITNIQFNFKEWCWCIC